MMTSPFVAPDRDAPRLSHIVSSPIGRLLLLGDGHALTGLWMIDAERHTSRVGDGLTPSPESFREVAAQLEAYFAGELVEFDLPLDLAGTEFQQQCWLALATIPYGQTVSYGEQARRLGLGPDAARAVGAANGQNPLPLVLPCHRVIGADGSLTGFGGGLHLKRFLLEHEGALLPLR
jgi:methylated-DNA-[protein]-cysteine S-methyltransferase